MLADRIQEPDEIQGTKKIPKLEETNSIIGNPAFLLINENILFCLDPNSQMTFRQVCQSWKKEVDRCRGPSGNSSIPLPNPVSTL